MSRSMSMCSKERIRREIDFLEDRLEKERNEEERAALIRMIDLLIHAMGAYL